MMDAALAFAAIAAICAALWWVAYKIEPHWVSKDGTRVICYAQSLDHNGQPEGRFREVRLRQIDDNRVEVRQRGRYARAPRPTDTYKPALLSFANSQPYTQWSVIGRSDEPPKGKEIFVLGNNHTEGQPPLLAIRLPASSRAVPMLQAILNR